MVRVGGPVRGLDLYDNYTIAVADRIVELGYWVGYGKWGWHNSLITKIVRPIDPAHAVMSEDDDESAPEGAVVYPVGDYRIGGYDDRSLMSVLPEDIIESINAPYDGAPGFSVLEGANTRKKVLKVHSNSDLLAAALPADW